MKLTTKQDIETGVLIALIALLSAWIRQEWTFILVAAIILGGVLTVPVLFRPFAFAWFGFAQILGYVMSTLLLTVLFFLLVTPVGIVRKWMGKDSLKLNNFNKGRGSILKNRNHTYQPEDLKNPF